MTIPPAPPKNPRGRRHTMKTVRLARQMYGDGTTWTPTQIKHYLAGRGIQVALHTVRLWVIPGMAEDHREKNRESYHRRRSGRRAKPATSETPLLDRMLVLREAGLTLPAIAAVIRLDYGITMTTEQVRYYVNERREPKRPKKLAAA